MTYPKVKVDANTIKIEGNLEADIPEPEDLPLDEKITETDTIEGRDVFQRAPRGARPTSVTTRGCGRTQISNIDLAAQYADRYVYEVNQ